MTNIERARQYAQVNAEAARVTLELAAAGEPGYEPESLAVQVARRELEWLEQAQKQEKDPCEPV
jgi:hypothetical protein